MFGLLNLNKPSGSTSRDVVNLVQALVKPAKVGHAGTLDPLAVGVLLVCIGPATRLMEYLQRLPKRYRGVFLLGQRSDTEDITGTVVELKESAAPGRADVDAAAQQFVGEIEQTPPIYSAKKVRGQRAYKLARLGKRPRLAPRTVTIYRIEVRSYEYPELELEVTCGSGTYMRSLGRDLGLALGSSAVMSALTRTAIGDFQLQNAVDPEGLTLRDIREHLISPVAAVASLPQVRVTGEQEAHIAQGRTIEFDALPGTPEYAAVTDTGRLAAILAPRGDRHLGPLRYFPPSDT